MLLVRGIEEIRQLIREKKAEGLSVGLVPTMGALHYGHLSLIDLIGKKCDFAIVWIFLNRIQFNSKEDFDKYPIDLDGDLQKLKSRKVDVVFAPSELEIYSESSYQKSKVKAGSLSLGLCGAKRPGHFDGVLTVIAKFFNIIKPDVCIFGEKDFQQLQLVKSFVNDFNYDIEIISAPIFRDVSGLAESSRNRLLSQAGKSQAANIYKSLCFTRECFVNGEKSVEKLTSLCRGILEQAGIVEIDYISCVDSNDLSSLEVASEKSRLLVAVYVEGVRLIDNISLGVKREV